MHVHKSTAKHVCGAANAGANFTDHVKRVREAYSVQTLHMYAKVHAAKIMRKR